MLDETTSPNGARPVGLIADASAITQGVVWALRAWLDPSEGANGVYHGLAKKLGPTEGARAYALIEAYFGAIAVFHSRPIHRHELRCACLGADEAMMGQILELAAFGQTASAMALAAHIISPEGLNEMIAAAAPLGRALLRFPALAEPRRTQADPENMMTAPSPPDQSRPHGVTLH